MGKKVVDNNLKENWIITGSMNIWFKIIELLETSWIFLTVILVFKFSSYTDMVEKQELLNP